MTLTWQDLNYFDQVRGKRVGLSASQDNDTLYLGNICKTWTKDNVRFKLPHFLVG